MNSETSCTREGNAFSLKALIQASFSTGITEPVTSQLRPVGGKTARPVGMSANQLKGQLVSPWTGVTTAGKTALNRRNEKTPHDRIRQFFTTSNPSPQLTAAPSPWPVVAALNREYHCAAIPEEDGSGLVIYPDDWLSESERRDALRFARENLPDLLKQLCLEHLPQRVRLAVDG